MTNQLFAFPVFVSISIPKIAQDAVEPPLVDIDDKTI
jgi:hypothetical protein